jgi:streptogramin lyase
MMGKSSLAGRIHLAVLLLLPLALAGCSRQSSKSPTSTKEELFVRTRTLQPRSVAPGFSSVGPTSTILWTFNALNLYDPALKSHVFYVTSFNESGGGQFFFTEGKPARTGQLIEFDYLHNRAQSWMMPAGIGAWGIIQGQDGNLYMGSYNEGKLMCFNPRTKKWLKVPQASTDFRKREYIICDLAQAPNGDIYYGTYPGAHLVRYDPRAKTVTDLGKVADENYVRWVAVTSQGIVLCGVGPRLGRVFAYNPRTRRFSVITPKQYQTPGVFPKPLVSDRYVVEGQHRPGSRVLVYDPKTLKLLHAFTVPPKNNGSGNQSIFTLVDDNHVLYQDNDQKLMSLDLTNGDRTVEFASPGTAANNRWYFDQSGNILGLLVQSYVYLNLKTKEVTHHMIPVEGLGEHVLWLNSFPDGLIYGGPGLGQTFFSFNPKTNMLTTYDQVIDRTGEIYYGIPYDEKLYTISYAEAGLAVFDPAKPWNAGETPSSNPRAILYIPEDQYRPVGGIHLGPGGKMYIGTQPDYGLLGGALSVFDPKTEKLEVHRDLIPKEQISAVSADDRYVYCGADPAGGGGSKPVARQAHFFVWDPQTQKIIFDRAFPTTTGLGAIAVVRKHAYFVTGDQLMDYDSKERTLKAIYHFDPPRQVPLESLKAAQDGTLWGILGDELAHIDPAAQKVEFFPETKGRATSGLAIGADGTIYFGSDTNIWIYHPKSPSPPAAFGQ